MPRASVDDIVQEAGVRALRTEVAYDDADDMLRWLNTVATRIWIDACRKNRRVSLEPQVPDRPAADDVARSAESRHAVEAVLRTIARLSLAEREALLQPKETWAPAGSREAHRDAMRRSRARARLAAMLGGAFGLDGLLL